MSSKQTQNISEPKSVLEVQTHPRRVYNSPRRYFGQYLKDNPIEHDLWFEDQTELPNSLKESTYARRTYLAMYYTDRQIHINRLIKGNVTDKVYIHILSGMVDLRTKHPAWDIDYGHAINRNQTCSLSAIDLEDLSIWMIPTFLPLMICIEICIIEPECPLDMILESPPVHYIKLLEQNKSVALRNLDDDPAVVVLATRFAWFRCEPYPIYIVVSQVRPDKVLMNTAVCPRTKVHYVTDEIVYHKRDHYDVLRELKAILNNKIVVGYETYDQLVKLRIDINTLAAIRDLKKNPCFGSRNDRPYSWRLEQLGIFCSKGKWRFPFSNVSKEAEFISEVYLKVCKKWRDDTDYQLTHEETNSLLIKIRNDRVPSPQRGTFKNYIEGDTSGKETEAGSSEIVSAKESGIYNNDRPSSSSDSSIVARKVKRRVSVENSDENNLSLSAQKQSQHKIEGSDLEEIEFIDLTKDIADDDSPSSNNAKKCKKTKPSIFLPPGSVYTVSRKEIDINYDDSEDGDEIIINIYDEDKPLKGQKIVRMEGRQTWLIPAGRKVALDKCNPDVMVLEPIKETKISSLSTRKSPFKVENRHWTMTDAEINMPQNI